MNPNSCQAFQQFLLEHGESAEIPGLERHLEDCAACAETLTALRAAESGLTAALEVELPSDFSRKVMANIRLEEAPHPTRPARETLALLGALLLLEGLVVLPALLWWESLSSWTGEGWSFAWEGFLVPLAYGLGDYASGLLWDGIAIAGEMDPGTLPSSGGMAAILSLGLIATAAALAALHRET